MKIKPDDYFNNGQFELARFGKRVSVRNIMTSKQHHEYIVKLKEEYPNILEKINKLVYSLQKRIVTCNPIQLLSFASDCSLMSIASHFSEFDVKNDEIPTARMTEYIQSILVASPSQYKPADDNINSDPSEVFFGIQKDIEELHKLIQSFYKCMAATLEDIYPDWDISILMQVFEAQTLFLVRGQRYQAFEAEYFKKLLKAHNDIFLKTYALSADQIIEGIAKLQYALSQGKADCVNRMHQLMDDFENSGQDETYFEEHQEDGASFYEEFFGTKLRNVIQVTGWSEKLVRELSYELGEETNFFNTPNFAGWPIIDLPIQKRPFIKIEEDYYCFDYYSFVDNIYRSIQKATTRLSSDYNWSDTQQLASEEMVASIFLDLLPGCQTYLENYYPVGNSLKQMAENDLIIVYSNTLLIVEVKAGSFVYTAPITDFGSHIKSYKALVEKADWQCKRTHDYFASNEAPILYSEDKNIKAQLDMHEIDYVYMMSVTVDNINDFAAKAEKLNFLNLKCNAISISVDDLMVYREYFKSPLLFLHFLKHRQLSTQEKRLALNDELDHLGMYIKHNYYTFQTNDFPKDSTPMFYGYREELDNYFCRLYHPQLHAQKPLPNIPNLFLEIISWLETNAVKGREKVSNYLLDFASDAKVEFCEQVEYATKRQLQTQHMAAIHATGRGDSLRYTCFVNQPQVNPLSDKEKVDYVLASIIRNKEPDRVMIDLYFDEQAKFCKVYLHNYSDKDVPDENRGRLLEYGEQIAQRRLEKHLATHPGKSDKIGRNQLCPCGSGKKHKRCCGQ